MGPHCFLFGANFTAVCDFYLFKLSNLDEVYILQLKTYTWLSILPVFVDPLCLNFTTFSPVK